MRILLLLLTMFFSVQQQVQAQEWEFDPVWNGVYRAEAMYLAKPALTGSDSKFYGVHHFILKPSFILRDGIKIKSRLNILNGTGAVPGGSQFGQILGSGMRYGNADETGMDGSPTLRDRSIQEYREIQMSEFYLDLKHPGGHFYFGRKYLNFGLGMVFNEGSGLFDHYYTSRDMIAHKFSLGSFEITPMFSRIGDNLDFAGGDTTEFGGTFDFVKKEVGLRISLLALSRRSDTVAALPLNAAPYSLGVTGKAKYWRYGLFAERQRDDYRWALELGFQSGNLGEVAGVNLDYDGFGMAGELDYHYKNWTFGGKAGYASGNDMNSPNKYSGFGFHRNYDVAFVMMNHPVGQLDTTGSDILGRQGRRDRAVATFDPSVAVDTDSVTNTMYFAPYAKWDFKTHWSINTSIVYARLNETKTVGGLDLDSELGVEWDLGLAYKPYKDLEFQMKSGLFFPGGAYEGGTSNFDKKWIFGLQTGVAFSF